MAVIPKNLVRKVNRFAGKAVLKLKKHLPTILVFGSAIAGAGAVIASGVESTKLDPVLDKAKQRVDDIHEKVAEAEDHELAVVECKKELSRAYVSTILDLTKLYLPAVALEALSWACLFTGHKIMRRRNMELAAAYTAMFNAFQTYRSRVKDRYGEDAEYDIYHNTTTTEVVDSETGEVTKVRAFNGDPDDYLEVFDSSNPNWDSNPIYCRNLLTCTQQYANDLLQTRGYLLWNEVKQELHMPVDTKGAVVGWFLDDNDDADKYVDLRIQEVEHVTSSGIMETWFTLDPNVDGTIVYKLDQLNKVVE